VEVGKAWYILVVLTGKVWCVCVVLIMSMIVFSKALTVEL